MTCSGCKYNGEVCSHPHFGTLAFYNAAEGHCYTVDEREVRALLELVRITNARARV